MNIDFTNLKPASAGEVLDRTEARTFEGSRTALNYRYYRSAAEGKARLFVYLHGAGGRGSDNRLQIEDQCALVNYLVSDSAKELLADVPYTVIAPQCPEGSSWVKAAFDGGSYSLENTPVTAELQAVFELMESLIASGSTEEGTAVLCGISMGGYGTWDLALRHPKAFSAIVPICGGGDPTEAERLKGLRIWAFHCTGDQSVPVSASRDMAAALKKLGIPADYTEFVRDAHNAWTPAFEETLLLQWLLSPQK